MPWGVVAYDATEPRAGQQLMDGQSNPYDMRGPRRARLRDWGAVLRVIGEKELQKYRSTKSRRSTGCRA